MLRSLLTLTLSVTLAGCGLAGTAVTGAAGADADVQAARQAQQTGAKMRQQLDQAQQAAAQQRDQAEQDSK